MKNFLLLFLVSISVLVVSCSGEGRGKSIKIGVSAPLTGDLASYGIPTLEAVQIITDKVNADGGINGRQIEVVQGDDTCDPNQGTIVASKLVAEEVVAVVGPICSGVAQSALPTYEDAGIPVVSPSATNPTLADYAVFFRTIAADDVQGVRQAEFLINNLGVKSIAIIHDQQDYGKGLSDSVKENIEALGGNIVLYEGITAGAVDFSAIVSKIINSGAEALAYGGYDSDGSKLLSQLRAKGYDGVFIAGDGFKGNQFIDLAGADGEGAYATGPADYSTIPAYIEAIEEYTTLKGENPGTFYAEGYAAISIVIEALKAGNTTGSEIQEFLQSGQTFNLIVGPFSFAANGNAATAKFDVYQLNNGVFEVVR